ncbi:MAG: cytochrome c554 family protein [Spirochaetes bacterium RBG_13_51_14]|nr:MAG: cytochrome c554 family protein [Spirochaetes bacterium RBG_13_51_14]
MIQPASMRCILCAAIAAMICVSCSKVKHYELSRFVSPETCGGCHTDIYEQWKGSLHDLSHVDPLYREVALHDLKGLTDVDELEEAQLCVKCHTPVGYVSGMPAKTSDHLKKIPGLAANGVQCDFCHSATGAKKPYNAELDLDPGHGEENPGTKRGPFRDSRSDFHQSEYSALHTRSEICGSCHDVRHVVFGTKLETPYEEWKKGPYAERGIACQDCHMRQRPGIPATGSTERPDNPGAAAAGGPIRKHLFTHYFVGANILIPSLFGSSEQAAMAEERLTNAAVVAIDGSIGSGTLKVVVKNTGAGHCIPTGLSHVRQIWLEVKITGAGGAVRYHSGKLKPDGSLDAGTVIYTTVFGDGKGRPVMNVAKAREILKDKRIEPLKSAVETYRIPEIKDSTLTVEAKLWYRIAPQDLADSVLGKGKLKIPAVLMATDKKIIQLDR